jgi:signal transduction histidine kinase
LVVSVSVRIQDVLAEWHNNAIWQGSVVCIMVCLIAVLFFRLVKALHGLDKAHAELQENLELVRKSDETKDKLFSVIAHDLRGPIGGMASLLGGMALDRRSISDEEMGQFLNVLRDTSWNTSQLLENLLAWSRSQRAELSFNPERLALLPLVMECEAIFELSSAEKGISVAIDIEEGLAARADPDQLRILVRNMLSNAIKFTPPGKSVRLRAARTRDGTLIEARDEGIGMNAQQIASLFDLGAARSRSGTANEKGSGLGLVLCKSIVDMHGGRIEVASEVGKGSSFSIFLPD